MNSNNNDLTNKDFQEKFLDMIVCPISLETLEDPVILIPSGHIYEKRSIELWLSRNNKDPLTNTVLTYYKLFPVRMLKDLIKLFIGTLPEFIKSNLVKHQDLSKKIEDLENKNLGKESHYNELCEEFVKTLEDVNSKNLEMNDQINKNYEENIRNCKKTISDLQQEILELKKTISNFKECKCFQSLNDNSKNINNINNNNINYSSSFYNINELQGSSIKENKDSQIKFKKFTKFYSLDDLKVMATDPMYKNNINLDLNYLSSNAGKELLKRLSYFNYEKGTILNLSGFDIGDYGVEFLNFCDFKKLEILYLNETNITDKAVKNLIKCDFNLKWLYLHDTQITDLSIEHLITCDFKQLSWLYLSNTQVNDISKLKTKYPKCLIAHP